MTRWIASTVVLVTLAACGDRTPSGRDLGTTDAAHDLSTPTGVCSDGASTTMCTSDLCGPCTTSVCTSGYWNSTSFTNPACMKDLSPPPLVVL